MAFTKFILPTLALAGHVLAQCDGPSITIETSTDAEQIASCEKYDGDVIIADTASGNIQLNGVKSISGDLRAVDASGLTALSADQLNSIGGTFELQRLTILSGLTFSSLTAVNEIIWKSLPALQALTFDQGISRANNIEISDTELVNLNGIELEAVSTMNINNNRFLTEVDVNSLANVTKAMTFAANSGDLEISLPNLESAANLTFINISSIEMPSLAEVSGSMGFYFNTFETFNAPNLTRAGSDIAFVSCGSLNNLTFPQLTTIGGGFLIANNSKLEEITGFPKLKTIAGALEFAGVFDKVTMQSLGDVRGGSNVISSSNDSSLCDDFDTAADKHIIKGDSECKVAVADPTTNGSSTSSSSGSSESSNAADSSLFNPTAPLTGLSALVAMLLFI